MPLAARITDNHTCPMVTGQVPHVGGPITTGSETTTIGDQPAARVGDSIMCTGPLDSVLNGSATVFIDDLPAARVGDETVHGGTISTGCDSVTIG